MCDTQVIITSTVLSTTIVCPCIPTSTTSSATSITTLPAPTSSPFRIQINTRQSRGRTVYYIFSDNDTAKVVSSPGQAADFRLLDGYLLSDGFYMGIHGSTGYDVIRSYASQQPVLPGWGRDPDRVMTLFGRDADVCIPEQCVIVIVATQNAPSCLHADLLAVDGESSGMMLSS